MNDPTEIALYLGQLIMIVLTVWFVVKAMFGPRASPRATRRSHLGDGIFMLLVAALWAGLSFLVVINAAFAGASVRVIHAMMLVGGAPLLIILWRAVRHMWQAFGHPSDPRPDK
jgi:hypothetical protein